jgi:hypothetical protein
MPRPSGSVVDPDPQWAASFSMLEPEPHQNVLDNFALLRHRKAVAAGAVLFFYGAATLTSGIDQLSYATSDTFLRCKF